MSDWDRAYLNIPPWDVGHPQKELVRLAESGEVSGSVLDIGCGTGENSLCLAILGHEVIGIDVSPRAIELANAKRISRKIQNVTFRVGDALKFRTQKMNRFENVIDCGLFHVFSDEDRAVYVKRLESAIKEDGKYFMMCMSNLEPDDWGGPRRVRKEEILHAFGGGNWKINYIRNAKFETKVHPHNSGARAWLSSISRV